MLMSSKKVFKKTKVKKIKNAQQLENYIYLNPGK
jgi:hypothetical protein